MFYFLSPAQVTQARLTFQQLTIVGPKTGDLFFAAYGPGNVLNSGFVSDFCVIDTSARSLAEIVAASGADDLKTAFDTTAKLRNTTGHNLVWDDIFGNPDVFIKLYRQVVNAIFYVIVKKFV